jgi:Right handed beta helix region
LNPAWGFTGTIPNHANVYMHDFTLQALAVGTQTGIKFDGGFFARFERLYLRNFANIGWGLHLTSAINVIIDECDFEQNGSGGVQFGPAFVNDSRVTGNLFGGTGSGFLSSDGFLRITGGSAGSLITGNAFENGTYGIVLGDCLNLDIINNFFEFHLENPITAAAGTCSNIYIARNHFHTSQAARIDLQFGLGGFDHEAITIRDNTHPVFGGSHTSILLFNPGDTTDYEFIGNDVYPVGNRGLLGVVYVAGFVGDNDAFFRKDFVKYWGPPVIVSGSMNFGSATHVIQRNGSRFEFAAPVSTDSAVIRGASSEVEVFADHIVLQPNGATVVDVLPTHVQVVGPLRLTGALGVGNSVLATTPGTVTRKMEVFDAAGISLGFIAIYDTIA